MDWVSPVTVSVDDPMLGRWIGGYRVSTLLAEGGMGKVYLLVHATSPELRRVLKVVHGWIVVHYPQLVERFFREARTAASLRHPNIIEIFDYSRLLEDGQPYLVMPFLDGVDLGEHVQRIGAQQGHAGRVSFEVALPLLLQACTALRAAHAKGIVHRDLKPSNCYVVTGDHERPRLVLLDFGIAKVLDPALRGDGTQTRVVLGTPGYMAPEQARGHEVDHRADIYALGVLAYEILTGRLPFHGITSEDLAIQQVNTLPLAPSALVPEIPGEVSALVMRCLAPAPTGRPATIMEVAQCLIRATRNGWDVAREVAPDLLAPSAAAPTAPASPDTIAGVATHHVTLAAASRWSKRAVWIALALVASVTLVGMHQGLGRDAREPATAQLAAVAAVSGTSVPDVEPARVGDPTRAPGTGAAAAAMASAAGPDAGMAAAAAPVAASARAVNPAPVRPPPWPAAPVPSRSLEDWAPRAGASQPAPRGSGELEIFVRPWAEIWLDGRPVGQTPFRQQLMAGRYRLRLENEDSGRSETLELVVTANQTTTIRRAW
ncbi:MAG TPA: serine/threonine-protein kinase [Kofleriaceae bacterium]|nr:serine/threonine-protein kinase [Kofleriaceae bacterium]